MKREKDIIALLGGDMRELVVAESLARAGWPLQIYGLPKEALPKEAKVFASIREALNGADAVILPLSGIRATGQLDAALLPKPVLVTADDFRVLRPQTPVIAGVVSPYLQDIADACHLKLVPVANRELIARPNAIPTAEGAIQLAMEQMPVTICGVKALVMGYGRVGEALALRLRNLGAQVTITNQPDQYFHNAKAAGFVVCPLGEIESVLPQTELLYNTIPQFLLDEKKLSLLPKDVCIIDLATIAAVDFAAAEELGLKASHALGLPGRVAPKSAGMLLASAYPLVLEELQEELQQLKNKERSVL